MRLKIVFALVIVTLLGVACGSGYSTQTSDMDMVREEKMVEVEYAASEPEPMMDDSEDTGVQPVLANGTEIGRMIIYNGSLDLVVLDTDESQQDIIELVEGMDGYIVNVNSWAYGEGLMNVQLTVRVPAKAFNPAMTAIRGLAMEVRQESVSSDDVTQEYVDLESRLRALEVKAVRLEELMEQAEDTEAVLAVYQELALTQQEIEQVKGRMRYLERSSAMATIEVQLTPDEISKPVEVAGWRPEGTMKRAIEALIRTFQWLVDVLLWVLLYIGPVLLVVVIFVFIIFKLLGLVMGGRRRKKNVEKQAYKED